MKLMLLIKVLNGGLVLLIRREQFVDLVFVVLQLDLVLVYLYFQVRFCLEQTHSLQVLCLKLHLSPLQLTLVSFNLEPRRVVGELYLVFIHGQLVLQAQSLFL